MLAFDVNFTPLCSSEWVDFHVSLSTPCSVTADARVRLISILNSGGRAAFLFVEVCSKMVQAHCFFVNNMASSDLVALHIRDGFYVAPSK